MCLARGRLPVCENCPYISFRRFPLVPTVVTLCHAFHYTLAGVLINFHIPSFRGVDLVKIKCGLDLSRKPFFTLAFLALRLIAF